MFMKKIFFLLFALFFLTVNAQELSLIPQPCSVEVKEGAFILEKGTVLYCPATADAAVKKVAEQFAANMSVVTGIKLKMSDYKSFEKAGKCNKAKIILVVSDDMDIDEEYTLDVREGSIVIEAAKPAGFFYAFQTLKQLMPRNVMAGVPDNDV